MLAEQSNAWSGEFEKRGEPKYDAAQVKRRIGSIAEQEALIDAWLESTGRSAASIVYEEMVAAPLPALEMILGRPVGGLAEDEGKIKRQRTSLNREWRARFVADVLAESHPAPRSGLRRAVSTARQRLSLGR